MRISIKNYLFYSSVFAIFTEAFFFNLIIDWKLLYLIILVNYFLLFRIKKIALNNIFDTELEAFRRYSAKALNPLFVENDLKILKPFSFNFIGIFGWYFSGNILKKKNIPEGQMGLFNRLVPLFKLTDVLTFKKLACRLFVLLLKKNEYCLLM
ncbi:MAG: hypothetical protein CUR32_09940 [Flavobacterium sp.]|nr:MAG: hypothetical protein CUR32_09940 [Flavobacterium sp.] [Flavobacterium sp. FEMGT703F]